MSDLLAASGLAAILAAGFVRALAIRSWSAWAMDRPNERSLHETPIPRTGGLGLFAGALISWMVFANGALAGAVSLAGLLLLPSLMDDIAPVSRRLRFAAQTVAALALLWITGAPALSWPVLVLAIVWMTNLYNFMDGSDGLAGGMTAFGFAGYALLAETAGARDIALVSAIVAGAALGFLVWNFSPAIIFLGDAGAVPLGFLSAALGLAGWMRGVWPMSLPLLLFAPFIIDATLTLLRRIASGEDVTRPHRTHLYQRLVRSGLGHRNVALAAYALMAVLVAIGFLAREWRFPAHLLLVVAAYALIAAAFGLIGRGLPAIERNVS